MKRYVLVLVLIVMLILFAPWLTNADPAATHPENQLQAPTFSHLLGTDYLGRDIWARILYGGRRSLSLAVLSTVVAVVPGSVLGILGASSSSIVRHLSGILIDTLLAFPALVLALVILTLMGQHDISLILAVGIPQIAFHARATYGATLQVNVSPYIDVSRALGASPYHIVRYHIIPGIGSIIMAYGALVFGYNLLNGAALSFLLGLSSNPSQADWGMMLSDGRIAFRQAPWVSIFPGICLTITIISVNRLADFFRQR